MITTEYATCQACSQLSNWIHDDGACPWCKKPRNAPVVAPLAADDDDETDCTCGASIFELHGDACAMTTPLAAHPAPAKLHDFSDPYCARRRAMGTVARLCITCGAAQDLVEARTDIDCRPNHGWREVSEMALCDSDGILRDGKVPERIERPKLAHSYGVECPALEDA